MIDKETIKRRKQIYGDSFKEIARLQSEYLGIEITPKQVAKSLAILKKVRIDFIKKSMLKLKQSKDFYTSIVQDDIKTLNDALEDSLKDFENYMWISLNYDEYEKL
ncbi:MAG: DUF6378 domain-containing protein [Paraclostridium sp.]